MKSKKIVSSFALNKNCKLTHAKTAEINDQDETDMDWNDDFDNWSSEDYLAYGVMPDDYEFSGNTEYGDATDGNGTTEGSDATEGSGDLNEESSEDPQKAIDKNKEELPKSSNLEEDRQKREKHFKKQSWRSAVLRKEAKSKGKEDIKDSLDLENSEPRTGNIEFEEEKDQIEGDETMIDVKKEQRPIFVEMRWPTASDWNDDNVTAAEDTLVSLVNNN